MRIGDVECLESKCKLGPRVGVSSTRYASNFPICNDNQRGRSHKATDQELRKGQGASSSLYSIEFAGRCKIGGSEFLLSPAFFTPPALLRQYRLVKLDMTFFHDSSRACACAPAASFNKQADRSPISPLRRKQFLGVWAESPLHFVVSRISSHRSFLTRQHERVAS